ncbi:threonine/serine dehydratase [Emcibacter sp.]|uniref:threonine ammonia-lyase n=1 Tax=Emcibacter sp. TaxID=1979954 RepID=UPI002AA829E2|nr:threonine/serine dehydratase [Emcibacter sp.]
MKAPLFKDIVAAADRIAGVAIETPLLENPLLNEDLGARIFLKPENLQRVGAFKFRGAYNRLVQLTPEERTRGVVAFSSGNHAQGVASAAKILGIEATIVMPSDAPEMKVENTRGYGARVVLYDRATESREDIAAEIAREKGSVVVPAFEDPHIIAGQGTAALEVIRQVGERGAKLDAFLCPVGGGGLASGSGIVLNELSPETKVYGVEPQNFDDLGRSLKSGQRETNEKFSGSVCDALLSPSTGDLTFSILQQRLDGAFSVSDDEALGAVKYAWQKLKLVLEPGGATGLAALLYGKLGVRGMTVAVLLSGGNVDEETFIRALSADMR